MPTCSHDDIVDEAGFAICTQCGEEVEQPTVNWRSHQNKYNTDSSRIQFRKAEEISIHHDVESMGFPVDVVDEANAIFDKFVKGAIYRGGKRLSIVYACIYFAFKNLGKPISSERLIVIFKLDKKSASEGFKFLKLSDTNCSNTEIRSPCISTHVIIEEIMDKFSASQEQIKEVITLYQRIHNKSAELNRARPQSVACGLVYYWSSNVKKNSNITIKEFTKYVTISSLTIAKIATEIEIILERQIIDKLVEDRDVVLTRGQRKDIYALFALIKKSPLAKLSHVKENIHRIVANYFLSNISEKLQIDDDCIKPCGEITKYINKKSLK